MRNSSRDSSNRNGRIASSPINSEINAFLEARRIDAGSADKTVEAYRRDLQQFAESLPKDLALAAITPEHLEVFLSTLQRAQKPSSLARKISALRQFFKFCCLELGLLRNPAERIESPQLQKRLPKCLSVESVDALLTTADQGLPYAKERMDHLRARDCAMIYLLYATGVRVSELVGMQTQDVDLAMGYVRVTGKGNKQRITPFAPVAGERVADYMKNHRLSLGPATDHLFVNHRGQPLTRQAFWKLLKSLALQAGISTSLSPHGLRHSFATHLLQSGINLRSLQMLLGHSDLSTTQIYAHVTPGHLKAAHKRYHPRGGD